MALWGNKDSKTATGTIAVTTAGAVTGVTTAFLTETKPNLPMDGGNFGYMVITTAGVPESYLITSVASNTSMTVKAGISGGSMSAHSAGTAYTLNEKPSYITGESYTSAGGGNPNDVYGIDTNEAEDSGDAIVGLSQVLKGAGYLTNEAPVVTIAAPSARVVATSAVTTATDLITMTAHGLTTGTALTYLANGGTALAPLVNATNYFVINVSANTIKLATSQANAYAGTVITLSGTGNNAQSFGGLQATAVAQFSAGSLVDGSLVMTNLGSDYTSVPIVTIDSPRATIATSAVATGTSIITFTAHGFTAQQVVDYQNGGGASATGLVSGTTYYVAQASLAANTFMLKTTVAAPSFGGTVAVGGTAGVFTCGATDVSVDDTVTITGTAGGTGSITGYTTPKSYTVSAVTGGGATTRTGFTLTELDATAVVSVVGTLTGLTYVIEDTPVVSGTGNNAQYIDLTLAAGTIVVATAEAIRGSGAGGSNITHAGWVRETIGTGGRAGRVNYETLVAMGSISGEATP